MDASVCTCHDPDIKPSSKLLRRNGHYFRGKNKVRRYQCRDCKRVFSFPPKKKRSETRGRASKLQSRKPNEFYSVYEYWAVQLAWRSAQLSGFNFHRVLEMLLGLSRKTYLPRVSRKEPFCSSEKLYRGLEKYERFYLPMVRGNEEKKEEYLWIENMKRNVFESHCTGVMIENGMSLSSLMNEKVTQIQQPFFVIKMLSSGVFEELRAEIQRDSFGIVRERRFPLEDEDFFFEYFYGK